MKVFFLGFLALSACVGDLPTISLESLVSDAGGKLDAADALEAVDGSPRDGGLGDISADSSLLDASDASDATLKSDGPPLTCFDGIHDGDESDVDCGGSCSACAKGKQCITPSDCKSMSCMGNVCQ